MNKRDLYKVNYDRLDIISKQKILNEIASHYNFVIKEYANFKKNGAYLYTAIYDDNGTEFVFIPGEKNVTLGWKTSISSKKENIKILEKLKSILITELLKLSDDTEFIDRYDIQAFRTNLKKGDYEKVDTILSNILYSFMDDHSSFLRTVDVEPMLVARKSESINWVFIKEISSKMIADDPQYFKIYQNIIKKRKSFLVKSSKKTQNTIKYEITEQNSLNVYKYKEVPHEEVLFNYASKGYSVPNINQWEYMASCGSSLFFSNDVFKTNKGESTPNAFGLYIADDIYKPEIISDTKHTIKAGDNGYIKHHISKKLANFPLNPFYNANFNRFDYNENNGLYTRKVITINLKKSFKPDVDKKHINKYITENMATDNYDNIIYVLNSIERPNISYKNAIKVINMYNTKGFVGKSHELVERFMNKGISDKEFLYLAGFTYFRMQNYEKAEIFLKKAISMKRQMAECYQILSYIYHTRHKTQEMEKALHDLFVLVPDIAESMINILLPANMPDNSLDYEDLWLGLLLDCTIQKNETQNSNNMINEVILLDSAVKLIAQRGIDSYIKRIRPTGSKYLIEILDKIENSKYINDETYLTAEDYKQALEEFTACKNIIIEAGSISDIKPNSEYLQSLTNTFFDCFPALITLAYIHYSNSRLFEAQKLFDEDYDLCDTLYKIKEIPLHIVDKIRVLLEDFILSLTMNILSYGQIQKNLDEIMEHINTIKEKYASSIKQNTLAIDLNITKDIKFILHWFNIEINLADALRKIYG